MSWDAGLDRDEIIELLRNLVAHHHFLEAKIVGYKEAFDKFSADVTAMADRVNKKLGDLQTQVATLQQQLANTEMPADAQATLDGIDATVNSLAVDAPVPPTPTPSPDQPVPTPDQPPVPTPDQPTPDQPTPGAPTT